MDAIPVCTKCGTAEVSVFDDDPNKTVCENCCVLVNEEHKYEYDKWRRGKFCVFCDKQQPEFSVGDEVI